MTSPYGSPEFYKGFFADILADIQADDSTSTENLVAGLRLAINEWQEHYRSQDKEFNRLKGLLSKEFTYG